MPPWISNCLSHNGTPKKAYLSQYDAVRAIDDCVAHGTRSNLRAYHCPTCGDWHLTSREPMGGRW